MGGLEGAGAWTLFWAMLAAAAGLAAAAAATCRRRKSQDEACEAYAPLGYNALAPILDRRPTDWR